MFVYARGDPAIIAGVSNSGRTDSCAARARFSEEPMYASVPTASAWLLLEQPGPWAADPMATEGLAGELADQLAKLSSELDFRVLLIRRQAGRRPHRSRRCFLVRSAGNRPWIRRLTISDPADLLDTDLGVLASDEEPSLGDPCPPMYLICTHGRRDPCCAEYGRALSRDLRGGCDQSLAECIWESSHQGGHRFAANLACFPHALFYGQVTPDTGRRIMEAYPEGSIVLEHYRGRSVYSRVGQAADYLVRTRDRLTGIDEVRIQGEQKTSEERYELSVATPAGSETVVLRLEQGPLRPESCNKPKLTPLVRYEMEQVNGGAP